MEQYVIKGGNPLYGEVEIGGAKNAALAILAAAIMTDETVTIDNLPNVRDINVLLQAIEEIGAHVERVDIHKVKINGSFIRGVNVDNEFIRRIRASYYLIGALLGKYKHAEVALPGGCDIGSRPIDLHMKGFRSMGADIDIAHGLVIARAKELKGTHIYMDKVSVGATINIMMAAAMADGKTVIENAAKEPHVVVVSPSIEQVRQIEAAGFNYIQIHGEIPETEAEAAIAIPILKAFNVSDMGSYEKYHNDSRIAGYVFDAIEPGSGKTFDWKLVDNIPRDEKLLLLAGGLNPDNVRMAIEAVHPNGVDVSSGVENDDGVGKNPEKIHDFVAAIKS